MATDNDNPGLLSQTLSTIAQTFVRNAHFEGDYKMRMKDAEAAKSFNGKELERLRSYIDELTKRNTLLKNYGPNDSQKVTSIVQKHPLKSLPMPCGPFFDELSPRFAGFIEEYDDEFSHTPKFQEVWAAFGKIQQSEDCITRLGQMARDLALVNADLRTTYIVGTNGEEHDKLVAINGTKAHPLAFLRAVPFEVQDDEEVPPRNLMAGIEELEKLTHGRDLILTEFMPVHGQDGVFYFPLSSVYVLPFLGMGINSTGPSIQVADGVIPAHEHFELWFTPGRARLWVSKTAPRGRWAL
ncbi:hypothetical protein HDK77DRAFT_485473 [Phyllosticta capitalensis]